MTFVSLRFLLLNYIFVSVIRPSIEYGSEVWDSNKSQAGSLESIILDGAKSVLLRPVMRQLEEIWV